MYRYSNGQISLSDFQQPMGMHLREDNRWVKKAQSIPWDKIEAKYEQQKNMYDNHTHSVENRIVSQPFVRPIVRGKAGKPVECGMKLDISVSGGWTRLEYHTIFAVN